MNSTFRYVVSNQWIAKNDFKYFTFYIYGSFLRVFPCIGNNLELFANIPDNYHWKTLLFNNELWLINEHLNHLTLVFQLN